MNKVLVCTPIVTGVGPRAYYHHIEMWKHVGKTSAYAAISPTDESFYGAAPYVEGPRKSPRLIRNQAVKELLKSEATHLFFLDDDILCPKNIIDLLLAADKPVIGSLIHKDDGSPLVWERYLDGERPMYGHPATGIFQCHAVALGAMMIKREVFESMSDPWFFFERNGRTMDVNFCREARSAGIEVWCSVDAACGQIDHNERQI